MKKNAATLFFFLFAGVWITSCGNKENKLKVGHIGGYLSASVYAAKEQTAAFADVLQFRSSSDIAYALLSGSLDAGFVEIEKFHALTETGGFENLAVAGVVSYPYGATLVLRKGLNVRLGELDGLRLAVSSPNCALLEEFSEDARRLEADLSQVEFKNLAFEAMIPALEAKSADAVLIKGSYSVAALQAGHSVLYQNWEMEAGDECCPAVVDQAALVMLVRRSKIEATRPFVEALLATRDLAPDVLRQAVADNTTIPYEILQEQPVPEFERADDALLKIFAHSWEHH